jgi:hypothetical protein
MPLNDWNMFLGYVFSSELLKILVIPPNMVLGVGKHHVFGRKLLGTLEVALPQGPNELMLGISSATRISSL